MATIVNINAKPVAPQAQSPTQPPQPSQLQPTAVNGSSSKDEKGEIDPPIIKLEVD